MSAKSDNAKSDKEVVIEVGDRPIRDVNEDMQEACKSGASIRVVDTLSRHNLGIGLPPGANLHFEGSVGYYMPVCLQVLR